MRTSLSPGRSSSRAGNAAQFGGFVVVGLISTVCNLSSRYLFQTVASYEVALVGAYTVGVLSAYFLNHWFVFESAGASTLKGLYRFTLVNLAGIALGWVAAVVLYRHVFPAMRFQWHPDLVAHAVGIAVPVLPNYVAHRYWTFGKP